MAAQSVPELMKKPAEEFTPGPYEIGQGFIRVECEPEYICQIHGDIGTTVQKLYFRLADGKQVVRTFCVACVCDYVGTLPIAQLTE